MLSFMRVCWLLGGFVNFLNWIELGGVHVC